MVKLVFIRGAPAVGKTTITKEVLHELKNKHGLDCAYVCEDDFRKQMQFKYKAKDLQAHLNSVILIKMVVLKLLELDHYDLIFIEGQFRYKPVIDQYKTFVKDNKYSSIFLQFNLGLAEMKRRDDKLRGTKSKDIAKLKKEIDLYIPKGTIIIQTNKSIESSVREVVGVVIGDN
ncbi:hypothetical protein HYU21_01535 [Candidatus Woesearchaeota archaeon]|nr:hypothetical protein [Candidatus Woesearchaeota archaeon]